MSVSIEDADMTNQNLGSNDVSKPQRGERGRATFTPMRKKDPARTRLRGAGYAQVMDNERARGWRLVLESGQSVPAITQAAPGIRIVVSGGELVESVTGQPDRAMSPKMGEFFWQDAGVTRTVRNTGTTRLELVEFEIR